MFFFFSSRRRHTRYWRDWSSDVCSSDLEPHSGYTTVYGGERFPYHGNFVPGSANGIGFEDLVVIEDYEFCRAVAERRPHRPGFEDALAAVSVQAALLRSTESGRWEDVVSLQEE